MNTNRLSYISDAVPGDRYLNIDIDSQGANNYTYDGNGNVTADVGSQITSITYNIRNLPDALTKSGVTHERRHDVSDLWVLAGTSPSAYKFYIIGADGRPEAAVAVNNLGIITHNVWGNGVAGQTNRGSSRLTWDGRCVRSFA